MLCVYPLAFHTAGEAGETDLAMRTFAPQPAPAPQSATMSCVAHCEKECDAASTHSATDHFRVVRSVP